MPLGGSPSVLRSVAMFVATFSMMVNPKSGFFPPAGALCALYVARLQVKQLLGRLSTLENLSKYSL